MIPAVEVLPVPLPPLLSCDLCLPVPRCYRNHADYLKHLRLAHDAAYQLSFRCAGCGFRESLKKVRLHQKRCDVPRDVPATASAIPPGPRVRARLASQRQMAASLATAPAATVQQQAATPATRVEVRRTTTTNLDTMATPAPAMESPSPRRRQHKRPKRLQPEEDFPALPGDVNAATTPVQASAAVSRTPARTAPPNSMATPARPRRQRRRTTRLTPTGQLQAIPLPETTSAAQKRATTTSGESPLSVGQMGTPADEMRALPIAAPHAPTEPTDAPTAPIQSATQTETLTRYQAEWVERFQVAESVAMMEETIAALTANLTEAAASGRPRPPQANNSRPASNQGGYHRRRIPAGEQFDAVAASKLQKLYRANPAKAVREVLQGPSIYCDIPKQRVENHFRAVHGDANPDVTDVPVYIPDHTEEPDTDEPLQDSIDANEIWQVLVRCKNTAPGPDGISYAVWRRYDPGAFILAAIFQAVDRLGHIPAPWRHSRTILIYKKGAREDLSNWRPISLGNTAGKLYASVIARRLAAWAVRNKRISPEQKGFMPYEGCLEHNASLQLCIQDARRSRKTVAVAWLDLANAFGSVPHNVIVAALRWAGLGGGAINVIRRLYTACTTSIRCPDGDTNPIPINAGVRQGCPLSPIIFNLAIEPLLRKISSTNLGYEAHGRMHTVLAYADDLALIASSEDLLQAMLNAAGSVASWAQLRFRSSKCASLVVDGKHHRALPTRFKIQGEEMEALTEDAAYTHLGVPTGYAVRKTMVEEIRGLESDVLKLDGCLLAPWQKLDAVRSFILPKLTFHLRCGAVPKGPLISLDKVVKHCAKRWLNLPQRASADILYIGMKAGGAGLLPLAQLADIGQLTHAVQLITSPDSSLATAATRSLQAVVERRVKTPPTDDITTAYLNGSMDGPLRGYTTDTTSMWTRLRQATRRLAKTLPVEWRVTDGSPSLLVRDSVAQRGATERLLRAESREVWLTKLKMKKDQGKVFALTSGDEAGNHFLRTGDFTRFADWRFVHRARLGVVPLNGCRRHGTGERKCRRCGYHLETLPHVLNHCAPHLVTVRKRHDAILHRLVKAFRPEEGEIVRTDQTVPNTNSPLRPDLTILNDAKKTICVVDVVMPFENGISAFKEARDFKVRKYRGLLEHYSTRGYTTFCDAFVVGPLGGYDPRNVGVLQRLRIPPKYAALMKKLMASDSIRWSRDIYVEHVTGHRQYSDPPCPPQAPSASGPP